MASGFEKESNILKYLHDIDAKECLILSDKECSERYFKTASIIDGLLSEKDFHKWKDNSKSQLPPDLINESDKIMLEVMRFDDHSKNGKDNPYRALESKTRKELGPISKNFPNAELFINVPTELSTNDDHNYSFYFQGFKKTVEKHLSKVGSYRKNYPDYKLGFLVFDESSGAYFERHDESNNGGFIHIHFLDKRFVEVFSSSDIDFLIWFSPYKHFETTTKHAELPRVVIYDIRGFKTNKEVELHCYDEKLMVGTEK